MKVKSYIPRKMRDAEFPLDWIKPGEQTYDSGGFTMCLGTRYRKRWWREGRARKLLWCIAFIRKFIFRRRPLFWMKYKD